MNSSRSTQAPGKLASFGASPPPPPGCPAGNFRESLRPEKALGCSAQFMLLSLVKPIKNLKFRTVMLKLWYKDWPAGRPLQDGLLFLFFSGCNGKCLYRRASAQPVQQGAGRRGHLHIVRDKLMVKLALTLFLFYPESLVVSFGA